MGRISLIGSERLESIDLLLVLKFKRTLKDHDLSFQQGLDIYVALKPDICHLMGRLSVFYHEMR
jgi:hypothetical protein